MVTVTLVLLLVFLVAEFFRRRWQRFQYFKRLGIPGPKPHILWGHFKELSREHLYWMDRWSNEYGETFGVFWGDKPILVLQNLELQKQVMITKFRNFVDRCSMFALEDAHPTSRLVLPILRGNEWKKVRSIMTPVFSSAKLKHMTPLILKSVEQFEENLDKVTSLESFDIYPYLKRLTMDNIARAAFGVDMNTQANPESTSPLLKLALTTVDTTFSSNLHLVCNSFTALSRVIGSILNVLFSLNIIDVSLGLFTKEIEKIVLLRKNAPPQIDLLQSLLDSSDENTHKIAPSKTLTETEVIANSAIMFIAGYETTSGAMGYILHCLGKHLDIQENLRREINKALEDSQASYDVVMSLKLLDRVVQEALRLYPPVTGFTSRRAAEDIDIEGITIPAGLAVCFPTKLIQHDPNLWQDPLTFNPDRFLEQIQPLAYQPFGVGPRNCIGMRFALLTIKLTLCKIIPKYQIIAQNEIQVRTMPVSTQPKEVYVSVKRI